MLVTTCAVVAALVALNLARHLLPGDTLWLGVAAALVLLGLARCSRLTWQQLGLGRDRLLPGAAWGAAAALVVAAVYLVAVLLPLTRPAFLDSRYELSTSQALWRALVVIPLGTVLVEEIAFRSVLWGVLARHLSATRVLVVSSSLFGLWHVLPALSFGTSNSATSGAVASGGLVATLLVVTGTVLFTALAGAVVGELRRRSDSVLAGAGLHWAANSLGVLFGLLAWQLAT